MQITDALVLSRHDYKDYDRMVTLLSPTLGRIEAAARGCRKSKSALLNASELFCAGEYALIERQGRYSIAQCEIRESFYPLREELDKLTCGAYLLHLISQAAQPDQPAEALFQTSLKALAYLSYSELPPALTVAGFEMHYARILGQSPRVDACIRCGEEITGASRFDEAAGGARCQKCPGAGRPLSHGARRILLRAPLTKFEAIEKLDGHPDWPEAAQHMRRFTAYRLDYPPKRYPPLITGGEL